MISALVGTRPNTLQLFNREDYGKPINLYLHPEDQLSKPVASIPVSTQNVLLKITVPKRTGRKRKRGSSSPFTEAHETQAFHSQGPPRSNHERSIRVKRIDCHSLSGSLFDNIGKVKVEAVGSVDLTHRWRSMSSQLPYCNMILSIQFFIILFLDATRSWLSEGPSSLFNILPHWSTRPP